MKKLIPFALFVGGVASGLGISAGGFGGIALPFGPMAAEDHGDLEMSVKVGGKFLVGVLPRLDLEAAVAYHIEHRVKDWAPTWSTPKTTIIPITAGANYKLTFGSTGVYVGGGAGFYLAKDSWHSKYQGDYNADMDYHKPGFYTAGGFLFSLGKFALDISPRLNYVLNKGTYTIKGTYNGQPTEQDTTKDFNDAYVDILLGMDFFFK